MSANTSTEFRATFLHGVGAFDIFHPSFFLANVLPHVVSFKIDSSDKIKTDEYLLIGSNRYNVKFTGKDFTSYDVKELLNPGGDPEGEDWKGLCKGDLEGTGLDFLIKELRSKGGPGLEHLVLLLEGGPSQRVFTKKHLCTMKVQLPAGIFTCESIDFSMWTPDQTQKRLMLRSVSLEGAVPDGLIATTLAALKAQYKGKLIFGGFPTMLQQALSLQPSEGEFRVYEEDV